jgi:hypothetical protein
MATQTTTVAPPGYQQPYLQYGLSQSKALYDQGGAPVIPFSPYSEQALAGTAARATAGSPVVGAANDYVMKSLQGGFLGQNPYLDQTFNQAALATQNQLASQFAGSGRNVGGADAYGLRGQQLNDLGTQIYGGNYQFERGLQQQNVGNAIPLANQDYVDLSQLRGAGTDVEGLASEYARAPGAALDQYLARVSGNQGYTQTSPLYRNSGAGALGGALVGSQIGSSVSSSPWAGWLGAIGGGLLGGYGGG